MSDRTPIDAAQLLEQSEWVRRLARGLALDAAAADDLVQEVQLAALLRRVPIRSDPRAWLAAVARNLALRWRRRQSVRRLHERSAVVSALDHRPPVRLLELQQRVRRVSTASAATSTTSTAGTTTSPTSDSGSPAPTAWGASASPLWRRATTCST